MVQMVFNGFTDPPSGNIAGLITGANVNKGKQKNFAPLFHSIYKSGGDVRH